MTSILPWIILFSPLLSAVVIVLFTQKLRNLSAAISVTAVLVSWVSAVYMFTQPGISVHVNWLDFGSLLQVPIGLKIDDLSKTMLMVVTTIGTLVHIYSLAYMKDDDGKSRFFAGLSIFMFSMLGIVLADNFVMMFIFWELVGVSSYILIGHWFHLEAPPAAANKAFITNRIGDFGFMSGILMLWVATKSVMFTGIAEHVGSMNPTYLTAATLLIFCGAVGKSAQFPLHVWLPDAMEGPTPVSALIHAATMVAAGVYMLARIFFLVGASPDAQHVIAWIGTITCVGAALIATQQNDIKRVLAYSTLSQLGYMVIAIGVSHSSDAAMFHLFTHACFKALLFLGAGSVIHALHHEQDMWNMGGLWKSMPITFWTFLIGTLALTGVPGLAGYFSKDAILLEAFHQNKIIFGIATFTVFLTSFYMFRLVIVAFLGQPKAKHHAHESPFKMTVPLLILGVLSVVAGWKPFAEHFLTLPEAEEAHIVLFLSLGALILGAGLAGAVYSGKIKDPIRIPVLANKFYIDELYAFIIRFTQDLLAKISGKFDRLILDGALVRGLFAGGTYGTGFVLRLFQVGNLQGYAFLFGAGVVAVLYFILFK